MLCADPRDWLDALGMSAQAAILTRTLTSLVSLLQVLTALGAILTSMLCADRTDWLDTLGVSAQAAILMCSNQSRQPVACLDGPRDHLNVLRQVY